MRKSDKIVGKYIASINEKLLQMRSNELIKLGIQPNEYNYFLTIFENPGCNQNYLAKKRRVDKAIVTRIIKKYEKLTLIERKQSPENKSAYSIYLTTKGQEIAQMIQKIISEMNESIKSHYSENEYEELILQLIKLSAILEGESK